jgi:hypothetical protein
VRLVQVREDRLAGIYSCRWGCENDENVAASPWLRTTSGRIGFCVGFPTIKFLRCRVTAPLAERRQMLLVDAIDLGLNFGMPTLDQDGEFTHQPSRAKPVE